MDGMHGNYNRHLRSSWLIPAALTSCLFLFLFFSSPHFFHIQWDHLWGGLQLPPFSYFISIVGLASVFCFVSLPGCLAWFGVGFFGILLSIHLADSTLLA